MVGCRNMLTLRDLLTDQEVKYNYTYQHPAIRTSFPTMILSTSASVLPVSIIFTYDTSFTLLPLNDTFLWPL